MQFTFSITLLVLSVLSLVGQIAGWDKDYYHNDHNDHSVHYTKKTHRAKTTSLSHSLVDPTYSKDKETLTSTTFITVTPTETISITKTSDSSVTTKTSDPATETSDPATCTHVPYGAKDEPAIHDPDTTYIFRETCGITDKTVKECPYLCGPDGKGAIKACFPYDVSWIAGDGKEICTHCLPPCKTIKSESVTSKPTVSKDIKPTETSAKPTKDESKDPSTPTATPTPAPYAGPVGAYKWDTDY